MTLRDLKDIIAQFENWCKINKMNADDLEVRLQNQWRVYPISTWSCGVFGDKSELHFEICESDEIKTIAPDKRPFVGGEYWKSRGIGYDLVGFVPSKLAGERLHRMVKFVLETDEPKSWLDYREFEPTWIQYKFQKEEFDLEKLHELTKENHIITIDILRECVIK